MTWQPEILRATLNNEAEGQSAGSDRRPVQLSLGGRERSDCYVGLKWLSVPLALAGAAKLQAESVQYLYSNNRNHSQHAWQTAPLL